MGWAIDMITCKARPGPFLAQNIIIGTGLSHAGLFLTLMDGQNAGHTACDNSSSVGTLAVMNWLDN